MYAIRSYYVNLISTRTPLKFVVAILSVVTTNPLTVAKVSFKVKSTVVAALATTLASIRTSSYPSAEHATV